MHHVLNYFQSWNSHHDYDNCCKEYPCDVKPTYYLCGDFGALVYCTLGVILACQGYPLVQMGETTNHLRRREPMLIGKEENKEEEERKRVSDGEKREQGEIFKRERLAGHIYYKH